MDTFYDGDLKDIWDSDLDPTESLKISTETDLHDWFLERDVKDPAVILNDKLISDALLNGTIPIKSEHSYSLNSDGDSLPDSPRSLHTKMDDMEDECYPAISLKTATSNMDHQPETITIDPKCLRLSTSPPLGKNLTLGGGLSNGTVCSTSLANHNDVAYITSPSHIFANITKAANIPMSFNLHLRNLQGSSDSSGALTLSTHSVHLQSQQISPMCEDVCYSPSSDRDGSTSPDIYSEIEIDESCIKDEPMSPDSNFSASPNSQASSAITENGSISLSMDNIAPLTGSDLVFEKKNGCLQLTPASQSLLKAQQVFLGTKANNNQNGMISKLNIKTESTPLGSAPNSGSASAKNQGSGVFGLPLTPPSSLPSDDSEGNLSPEHLLSPLSPNNSVSITIASKAVAMTNASTAAAGRSTGHGAASSPGGSSFNGARIAAGGSSRQPIHTPLISSQPKGSTGTLSLTEEEKRTLLAEGYPIPQKLPLSKAEEKSLKKIRRKIKNKISAQESRRKKKEYMDQLERRVELLVNENNEFKVRVDSLEDTNANLLSQLHKLQSLFGKQSVKKL